MLPPPIKPMWMVMVEWLRTGCELAFPQRAHSSARWRGSFRVCASAFDFAAKRTRRQGTWSAGPCYILWIMSEGRAHFETVEEAVEEIRQGRMIVLVDDEDRENEGDLAMAAE